MRRLFVLPDTNVFMHFRLFTEIDWASLLGADEVVLLITGTVLKQLDRYKDSDKRPAVQKRVRRVQQELERILGKNEDGKMHPGSSLKFYPKNATEECRTRDLDPVSEDQYLVGTALIFQKENGDERIVIVTDDVGMRITARHFEIDVFEMPDDLRLVEQEDEETKRLKASERELQKVLAQRPQPDLQFIDGATHVSVALEPPIDTSEEAVQREAEKETNQYKTALKPASDLYGLSGGFYDFRYSDYDRYNEELREYKAAYLDWLREAMLMENRRRRTVELQTQLVNFGTTSASKLLIELFFPAEVEIARERPRDEAPPQPPKPPSRDGFGLPHSLSVLSGLRPRDDLHWPIVTPQNVSEPEIQAVASGTRVRFEVMELLHNVPLLLDPLFATLKPEKTMGSFGFDYLIHSASLPEPRKGTLHVVVDEKLNHASESGDKDPRR